VLFATDRSAVSRTALLAVAGLAVGGGTEVVVPAAAAAEHGSDLGGLLLVSVSHEVLERVSCPVLVVRAGRQATAGAGASYRRWPVTRTWTT
jgi:hypothetical protein